MKLTRRNRNTILANVRALGMRISYDAHTEEYRVNFPDRGEASAYYTQDIGDAQDTAIRMFSDRRNAQQHTTAVHAQVARQVAR